ncbi:MAG TPA: hypothetical protein VLC52_04415 [Anaerolineae bacterium]|nr:hypothetical protein [Anaerolineae bacterium]
MLNRFRATRRQPSSRQYLLAILGLSVFLRLAVALYLGDKVDSPELLIDQRSYHWLGARLISGYGFSFDKDWYPFTLAGTPTAHWSFLYSLLVAAVYLVAGAHPLAVRLLQAVVGGLLLPWMVYRLAGTLFSDSERDNEAQAETIALVAALIAAAYGYFILYAATLMTETLFLITLLWSLERGLVLSHRLRAGASARALWPLGLVLGLSLGLATLLRQSILPWVPLLFLVLLWLGRRSGQLRAAVAHLVLAGSILVAFVVPWTVRNYAVYDDFLLLNSNAGYAMYSAQHPMHGTSFREFDGAPLPDGVWGRSEPELDRALMEQGIQFILDDPGRYLLLSLSRFRAFFEFWPTPDTTLLHNIGRTGSFGLLFPFLLYGLVLGSRRPGFVQRNALLFLFAAFYTALHVMTWAMVRYRLPVDAAMIPLAALAFVDLVHRARTDFAPHGV